MGNNSKKSNKSQSSSDKMLDYIVEFKMSAETMKREAN